MKRSLFLLITAILAAIFGGLMLFSPDKAAEGFGLTSAPDTFLLFRIFGGTLLSIGILNYMIRNHADSATLKSILIFNVLYHAIGMTVDSLAVAQGALAVDRMIPGLIAHLFVGIGSLDYPMKIKVSS